jgi:hypothetical protein
MILSRICECYVCGKLEITDKALLPDGWAVLWEVPKTVCNECLDKWQTRFGERPGFWLEGGTIEPTLF